MDLKNKIAVVVGASGGIGGEIARALEGEDCQVVQVSRSAEKYACDLKDPEAIKKVTQKIIEDYGRVDLLFNAAGVGVYTTLEDSTLEGWSDSFAVNTTAPFLTARYLLPALQKSESAVVFSLGSGMGVVAEGGRLPYCASKFALRGLSLSLADEFKGTKIRFCLLTLGSVLTEFGPLTLEQKKEENLKGKPYLTAEWVAGNIIKILKEDALKDEIVWYPSGYQEEHA